MSNSASERPVTLVTGTSRGIGRALAEHYLGVGHRVIGVSRSPSDLEHEHYRHFAQDVCDEAAAQALFSQIRKQHGRLDHLVNNAGVAAMNHSLLTPMRSVEHVMRVNFQATYLYSREAAKLMKSRGFGRIVNFGTMATRIKLAGESVYAASKAAVISLTEVLAREYGEYGITVNALAPNPVDTDLLRGVPKEKVDWLIAQQAVRRPSEMADVLHVVDFFLQPRSGMVTGQVIYLGGV